FEQVYLERRGGRTREHRFELTFRTLTVQKMRKQLERAGFEVRAVLGDYAGRPWDERADVWIILAGKGEDFRPCQGIPSGIPSSTRRARPTQNAARFSRA